MRAVLVVLVLLVAACDGEDGYQCPALEGDIADQLAALDGVTVEEVQPMFPETGHRYFDLWFTEPVDHDDPSAGTFQLYAALIHTDVEAPLVVYTSGYDAGWTRSRREVTWLVGGNQISLEYRFYGTSRPDEIPWRFLRAEQAVSDHLDVLDRLGCIYGGSTIATGGSKGGGHALELARRSPYRFDGVVAYVAPVNTDLPDLRYDGVLDRIGIDSCRDDLRAVSRRMLERRDIMAAFAQSVGTYDILGADFATEVAILELEWGFWMTRGEDACAEVPDAAIAGDGELWVFLEETSSPAEYADIELTTHYTQYYYQVATENGYPVWNHEHLDDLLEYTYEDLTPYLPPGEPVWYDPTERRALAAWVEREGQHILAIGGEWDPWAAGSPVIEPGRDAHQFWTPHGTHWNSGIYSLPPDDQERATEILLGWAGVTGTGDTPGP